MAKSQAETLKREPSPPPAGDHSSTMELKAVRSLMRSQVAEASLKSQALETRIEALERDLQESEQTKAAAVAELADLLGQHNKIKAVTNQLWAAQETTDLELSQSEAQIRDLTVELDQERGRIKALRLDNSQLAEEVKAALERLTVALGEEAKNVEAQVAAATAQLHRDIRDLKSANTKLESDSEIMRRELTAALDLAMQQAELSHADSAALLSENAKLLALNEDAVRALQEERERAGALQGENARLLQGNAVMLRENEAALGDLSTALAEAKKRAAEAQLEVIRAAENSAKLVKVGDAEIKGLSAALDQERQRTEELRTASTRLAEANARLEEETARLTEHLTALKAEEERERQQSMEALARLEAMADRVALSLQGATPLAAKLAEEVSVPDRSQHDCVTLAQGVLQP